MKKLNGLILLTILFLGCAAPQEEETEEIGEDYLVGSWKLINYIDHSAGDTTWNTYGDSIIYLKHLTPTHFTWLRFNKNSGQMEGTGGGSYTFDGKTYQEDIDFFYPPGSALLGQTIPFTAEFEEGKWYHTGFSMDLEFDPETAEMAIVDSTKIEEIWVRVDAPDSYPENMVGTWELVSYKEENDSIWSEHPDFVGYLKLITPTHFNWVYYNAEGDEITGEAGGTYTLSGDTYTENVLYHHPPEQNLMGLSIPFDYSLEDGKWHHKGYIVAPVYDPETGEQTGVDSSWIEEIWQLYGSSESL